MTTDGMNDNKTGTARTITKGAVQRFVNLQPVPASTAVWRRGRVVPSDPMEQ